MVTVAWLGGLTGLRWQPDLPLYNPGPKGLSKVREERCRAVEVGLGLVEWAGVHELFPWGGLPPEGLWGYWWQCPGRCGVDRAWGRHWEAWSQGSNDPM